MDVTNDDNNALIKKEIEARRAFLFTLEWLLALLNRYASSIQFDLVHIELGSDHELGETFGAQEAFKQLALLTTSLTNDFRKTDIITRHVTNYWILVPYDSNREQIQTKIVDIFRAAKHKDLNIINREISIFSLPLDAAETTTNSRSAIEFLEYLKTNKKVLASKTFTLSANYEFIDS
ncbi:MAG TPA: diguanylate cyclase [Methylotenera sp.]